MSYTGTWHDANPGIPLSLTANAPNLQQMPPPVHRISARQATNHIACHYPAMPDVIATGNLSLSFRTMKSLIRSGKTKKGHSLRNALS